MEMLPGSPENDTSLPCINDTHPVGVTRPWVFMLAISLLLPAMAWACPPSPVLKGVVNVPQCDSTSHQLACIPAGRAVFEGMQAFDIPHVFTIGLQTSPWRMYDGEGRILLVEEMAAAIRADRQDHKRVHLVGSWTAARPDGGRDTLANRLSSALDGLPVDGTDGFLWLNQNGQIRTTQQAISLRGSGPYEVPVGADVMMAMVPGALVGHEDHFFQTADAEGLLQAAIGQDVFVLCPQRALAAFERAAELGSAIGAYNAGLMHAEAGNTQEAATWLARAVSLGEPKAASALARQRPGK